MNPVIIIPYFGSLPTNFSLFLLSCKENKSFTWLIFTDDTKEFLYPKNVKRVYMTFSECQKLIKSKFEFDAQLPNPKKLCDYKVAYGYIFSDYIKNYSHWGFGDIDLINGNLNHFITEEMLEKYDKIFSLGHLSLFKNNTENNKRFMLEYNGTKRYREVFENPENVVFDEWKPGNINEIFLQSGVPIFLDNLCADIDPYHFGLVPTYFDVKQQKYYMDSCKNHIFEWKNGQITDYYAEGKSIKSREFPYVHLQKRKMKIKFDTNREINEFFIIPNEFILKKDKEDIFDLLRYSKYKSLFTLQFFKVKYNSLKVRINIFKNRRKRGKC